MREVVITTEESGGRLDKFLFRYLNNAPHSFIYRLIRTKKIKLNGKRPQGGEITLPGDLLAIYLTEGQLETCIAEKTIPWAKEMPPIIFEDGEKLIINKPAGLAAHSGGANEDNLLARALYYLSGTKPLAFTPALCNRLDVNTSGIIVCAKTFNTAREINRLFAERLAEKEYAAVAHGKLTGEGMLEGFYRKDENANKAYITVEDGGEYSGAVKVITRYKAVRSSVGKDGGEYTLVSVYPVTGRSHQIRAHLAAIGHPLLGDVKYGGKRTAYAPGQMLHCGRLKIGGESFEAELPDGFKKCAEAFGLF